MASSTLFFKETPPSFNDVGYTGNRWALTKAVKHWKAECMTAMMVAGLPRKPVGHVTAAVRIVFPSVRGRDAENYRVVISKALADALQEYGALEDDTAEFFTLASVVLDVHRGSSETHVTLRW